MIALVGPVFLASLVGSPHCAGMCGGFVAFYAGHGERRPWAHAAYNGGRWLSYVGLGLVAGALGAGVDRMGAAAGLSRAAAVLAGALMIAWGATALLVAAGVRLPAGPAPALHRRLAGALRAVHGQPPEVRALVIGLLSTLLPCGFLYAFVAAAAATGSAVHGALVMAAFWLGTVPVMAGLGLIAQRALGPLRRRLPLVTAAVLIVVGLLTVTGRIMPAPGGAGACPHCATAAGEAHERR
uniref:Sulfite exporter TauE/SafE family protein n=1 Tax=Eiseniibacteriota bacterium TaxID=2212470 RepID=A0A832MIU2_UNCEI